MTDEPTTKGAIMDVRLEHVLGRILQGGVFIAAAITAVGGIMVLSAHGGWQESHATFAGSDQTLRSLAGILHAAASLNPVAIIQTGLLVLILTPVLRVAASLLGFVIERDWLYVLCTLAVLTVLAYGLASVLR